MKQHSTDNTIPTAADDAVDEADSAVAASKTTDETTAKTTDKIANKTTNDTSPLPCDSAVPRLSRIALPVCSVIGVALAAAIVWAWFPHGSAAWTNPLHEIDAPAHYYFIRKILGEGVGAATHLWPNDEYYPPLFHLLAAGMIKLASLFGVNLSIYAAFNTVWLATSGLVWPIAIQLYASYFTRRLSHSAQSVCSPRFANVRKSSARNVASVVVPLFPAILALIIPPLAVASASHPFQMLASGPLIAFGLAATLLPFWLYATLRLLDALATREHLVKWIIWFFVTAGVCMFAHPRIVFTWLLLMAPFVLTRLPWKAIAGLAGVVVLGAAVFLVYMMSSYKSDRYFNPASWFHTFVPNRTVPEALKIYVTDNIGGVQGWFMAAIVLIAFAVTVAAIIRPQWFAANRADSATVPGASAIDRASDSTSAQPHEQVADFAAMPADRRNRKTSASYRTPRSDASQLRRDAIAILLAFFLVGLVYVCSTALTGWFPNIVAAAWYRAETRPLTMIPFGVLPLIVFAAVVLLRAGRLPNVTKIIAIVLLAALAISCQFGNTVRSALSDAVYANMTIDDARPDEQLEGEDSQEGGEGDWYRFGGGFRSAERFHVCDGDVRRGYAVPDLQREGREEWCDFRTDGECVRVGRRQGADEYRLPAERGWRCILPEHGRPGAEPADVHVQAAVRYVPRSEADRPVRQRWHDAQGSGLFEYGFICEGLGVVPVQLPVITCVA